LPEENSVPQPIILVIDRFQCQAYLFSTQSRKIVKAYSNSAYDKRRVSDEDLFRVVKLQSWFSEKKARYWVVDKAKGQEQERQRRRAVTRDVREETDNSDYSEANSDNSESD
jgi:hypothetical protein